MRPSIIIPHRDRNSRLAACLWSLRRSADLCDVQDYEVLVVDGGSAVPPEPDDPHVRVIGDLSPGAFHKTRLLNLGIDSADGDVLVFLDGDSVVGQRWFTTFLPLADPSLIRVCYRVRRLPEEIFGRAHRYAEIERAFERYDDFELRYEAWGRYDRNLPPANGDQEAWGNSQFAIRRDNLGDLRYDEGYVGFGCEDQDMMLQIAAKFGDDYAAFLWEKGPHAILHLDHKAPADNAWRDAHLCTLNWRRYKEKRKRLIGR